MFVALMTTMLAGAVYTDVARIVVVKLAVNGLACVITDVVVAGFKVLVALTVCLRILVPLYTKVETSRRYQNQVKSC